MLPIGGDFEVPVYQDSKHTVPLSDSDFTAYCSLWALCKRYIDNVLCLRILPC